MIAGLQGGRKSPQPADYMGKASTRLLASSGMPSARPLPVDPLVALVDRCVQCGLCLPACPTYGHDQVEAESPRGRIALMRAWALETIEPTPTGDTHLDHCLGCRNCEAVCPAGVKYDELLVLGRDRQRERREPVLRERLIEALVSRPRLLRRALAAYRRAYRWLPRTARPLPPPPALAHVPARAAATIPEQSVALFVGCVADAYEAPARAALGSLCAALQVELQVPARQTCCGSLHAHAGNSAGATQLAQRNRDAFGPARTVLTLASGCHDNLARSLPPDTTTLDALVFLDGQAERLHFRAHHERVALHLPCTQRNASGSVPALRRLLARVPGLEVVEINAGFGCCGAAGTRMLTEPDRADDYRRPLLAQLHASGATRLLSANIGCRLHLANGTALPVLHPVEFLAQMLETGPALADHRAAIESAP